MSFYIAFLACLAFSAVAVAIVGFAVFVWLQVLNELEERQCSQEEATFIPPLMSKAHWSPSLIT
jgi:hypothetical protein